MAENYNKPRYKRALLAGAAMLFAVTGYGQFKDSTSEFKFSGYADAYYARYSDEVPKGSYEQFPVISPKNNEFGLNIVQLTAQYTSTNIRATATLHYGDIPASAWSSTFNMIQEANVGIRLGKKLWLDAGFFKTHVGTEALLPKDNIASTLSVITVYEPWWQSGFKLTYDINEKNLVALHVLNGYNTFTENNSHKTLGMTVLHTEGDKWSLGYYNVLGDESPDSSKVYHVRFLNNLVLNYKLTSRLKALVGVDYIGQQNSQIADNTKWASCYSAIATLRYQLTKKLGCYGRYEMFSDKDGFLTGVANRYQLNGVTLGLEHKPTDNSYIRLEARDLIMDNDQKIFYTDGQHTNTRYEVMVNVGVWF